MLAEHTGHFVEQLLSVEGLIHEVVDSRTCATTAVERLLLVGKNDYQQVGQFPLELLTQLIAVFATQLGIDQSHGWALCSSFGQGIGGVLSEDRSIVLAGEGDLNHLTHRPTVIDGEQSGGQRDPPEVRFERLWIIWATPITVKEFAGASDSARCVPPPGWGK